MQNQNTKQIKTANKIVLRVIIVNLLLGVVGAFLPPVIGQLIISIVLSLYALKKANKEHIAIPLDRPVLKKTLLCSALTVTAFPIALFLNYLGSRLGGSAGSTELSYTLWQAILVIGILPAIAEEVTFRGLIQGAYMRESVMYSILLSSIFFSLIHGNISAVLYAFFYGCLFALVRIVTNNLVYTMIMHSLFNIINVSLYYGKDISLSPIWMIALSVLIGLLFCFSLGCFIHYNNVRFTEQKRSVKEFMTCESVIAIGICSFVVIVLAIM